MTSQHSQRWIAHFSGQATPWRTELAELVSDPALAERLAGVRDAGEALLAPVAPELLSVSGSFDIIADPVGAPASPATSMPGIFLAQYGAYLDIAEAIGSEPDAASDTRRGSSARRPPTRTPSACTPWPASWGLPRPVRRCAREPSPWERPPPCSPCSASTRPSSACPRT